MTVSPALAHAEGMLPLASVELRARRATLRHEEFTIGYAGVSSIPDSPAWMGRRDRLALYSFAYGIAPAFALEIGRGNGGSTAIISAAMTDVGLGGVLLSFDTDARLLDPAMADQARTNTEFVNGVFPTDLPSIFRSRPTDRLFELALFNAENTYEGALGYLRIMPRYMASGAFILCHNGYNAEQSRGLQQAAQEGGLLDCGMVTRCVNDYSDPQQLYSGLRLLKLPGEMAPNSE
jgi:cephalosporin hydroxylase